MRQSLTIMLLTLLVAMPAVAQEFPLLKTRWTQDPPYNLKSPLDKNGYKTKPGCGAVALAQVLNHYRKWDHGFGRHTYYSKLANDTICLVDVDFDNRRFDWPNILLSYLDISYDETQALAVADLIYQTGAAIRMQFRKDNSAPETNGTTLWGIHHFLHYSPKAMLHRRRDYSSAEWVEMVQRELDAGRPIYYAGNSYSLMTETGHIFVIDGYDGNGGYHVNWGIDMNPPRWGVDLNVLNQLDTKNALPGGMDVCYCSDNYMITDLQPAEEGEEWYENGLMLTKPILISGDPDTRSVTVDGDETFSVTFELQNYSIFVTRYDFCFALYDANDSMEGMCKTWIYTLGPGSSTKKEEMSNLKVKLPQDIPDGDYRMRLVCRDVTKTEWHPVYEMVPGTAQLSVRNGTRTVTLPENHRRSTGLYLLREITASDSKYPNTKAGTALNLSIKNPSSSSFNDTLRLTIDVEGEKMLSFKTKASVYDGCEQDYAILIPESKAYLKGKKLTVTAEYWDEPKGQYLPLVTKDPSPVRATASFQKMGGIRVFDIQGHLLKVIGSGDVATEYAGWLQQLPRGVYFVKEGDRTRKIIK